MEGARPRILVVDDEEAILETMTFTFEDEYDVYTSTDARRALDILDEHAPIAAVLTDQRMPNMSGVEFVAEVCKRHPLTVRMILTGFSDMDAIIQAINDGHVYSYVTKPWEPEQLKQVMKQAVEHHKLAVENDRLLGNLKRANLFLEAVMDELDTGALAVDADGVIQAVNRPVREFLGLDAQARTRALKEVLERHALSAIGGAVMKMARDDEGGYEDVEVAREGRTHRFRVTSRRLTDGSGETFGRVVLLREVSHEPLQRRYNELLTQMTRAESGELRDALEAAQEQLPDLAECVRGSQVDSAGMNELAERISRTLTSVGNWLEVDDTLAREDFPDAQILQDRMRVATTRWPHPDEVPEPVRELSRRVEEYYESGENPKRRTL